LSLLELSSSLSICYLLAVKAYDSCSKYDPSSWTLVIFTSRLEIMYMIIILSRKNSFLGRLFGRGCLSTSVHTIQDRSDKKKSNNKTTANLHCLLDEGKALLVCFRHDGLTNRLKLFCGRVSRNANIPISLYHTLSTKIEYHLSVN
jgi:hypothetical protein